MIYHAVGNRCAVNLHDLRLPISPKQALHILEQKGFTRTDINTTSLARSLVGKAKYRRGAKPEEAPHIFDCSSLIKWIYGQKGIWLPRRSIQQREFGTAINPEHIREGDIIFTSGFINYFRDDPTDGVGHVGIATNDKTVIHAANKQAGVIESSFTDFIGQDTFRGIKRILLEPDKVLTFETPAERKVEWSDDFRWIILQNLPK